MPKTKVSKTAAKAAVAKTNSKKAQAKTRKTRATPKAKKAVGTAKSTSAPKKSAASAKKKTAATSAAKVSPKTSPKSKKASPKKEGQVKKSPATATKKKARVSTKELAKTVDKNIEPHALNDDDTEKVRALIHLSREQGYLTFKDIDNSLPEIANQPEELQNVISIFNNLEIKLLDSKEVDKFKKKKEEKKHVNQ